MPIPPVTDFLGRVVNPFALIERRPLPQIKAGEVIHLCSFTSLDWILYAATGIFLAEIVIRYGN